MPRQFSYWKPNYITNGLVGWWRFKEGQGNIIYDSSGNDNIGTLVNSPTWNFNGIRNNIAKYSLNFNGINQYINLNNPTYLQIVGKITLSMWIYLSSFPPSSGNWNIIEKGYDGTNEAYWLRMQNNSGIITIGVGSYQVSPNQDNSTVWNISGFNLNTWNLLTGTYDGNNWNLYFNGNLVSSTNNTIGALNSNLGITIGAANIDGTISRFFNGILDDVRIYNRALSSLEITKIYNLEG